MVNPGLQRRGLNLSGNDQQKKGGGMKQLEKWNDQAYAVMRIVMGLLFAFHGMQKIFGVLSQHPAPAVGSQIWIGGVIELVGGLLIAVGFQTRWAAFLSSGTMAVAYFQFHWKFQMVLIFFLQSIKEN